MKHEVHSLFALPEARYLQQTMQSITEMKTLLPFLLLLVLPFVGLRAQVVFETSYKSEASHKVYVTKYKSEADVIVYLTDYKSEAKKDSGIWYMTKYKSESDIIVYFTEYKSEADIKVYYTTYKSEAVWK